MLLKDAEGSPNVARDLIPKVCDHIVTVFVRLLRHNKQHFTDTGVHLPHVSELSF